MGHPEQWYKDSRYVIIPNMLKRWDNESANDMIVKAKTSIRWSEAGDVCVLDILQSL